MTRIGIMAVVVVFGLTTNAAGDEAFGRMPAEQQRAVRARLAKDPQHPQYHFLSPVSSSDPDGTIYWNGEYHLFFQHFPVRKYEGPAHWGHAVSKDLVHWKDLPIALDPDPDGPDHQGVYSGSTVINNGVPTLVYKASGGGQCIATSRDGMVTWEKYSGNPVCDSEGGDPCVWKEGDTWYMGLNHFVEDIGGRVLLFKSKDLIDWEYMHELCVGDYRITGRNWECPDFFPLGGKHVLLVSSHGEHRWSPPRYVDGWPFRSTLAMVGTYKDHKFHPETYANTDFGGDLYAARTLVDDRGRRILFGWLWDEPRARKYQFEAGWAGVMSLPRVLTVRPDNTLDFRPARELHVLRRKHWRFENKSLRDGTLEVLPDASGDCLEILAEFERIEGAEGADRFGLLVRRSPEGQEETQIAYHKPVYIFADDYLSVDRNRSTLSPGVARGIAGVSPELKQGENLKLHIFLDRSVLEIFANGRCLTRRIYPSRQDSTGIALFASGGSVNLKSMDVWRMGSIWPQAVEAEQEDGESFTLAVLPDTQIYLEDNFSELFLGQIQWIKDNREALNIVGVVHEGDIIHRNTEPEWQTAKKFVSELDGIAPYFLTVGNHDVGPGGSARNRDTQLFNKYFGASEFEGKPWYGGHFGTTNENAYYFFEAAGMKFLVICLEFGPRDEVLQWANDVVSKHPDHRTIVNTHCYMNENDERVTGVHNFIALFDNFAHGNSRDSDRKLTVLDDFDDGFFNADGLWDTGNIIRATQLDRDTVKFDESSHQGQLAVRYLNDSPSEQTSYILRNDVNLTEIGDYFEADVAVAEGPRHFSIRAGISLAPACGIDSRESGYKYIQRENTLEVRLRGDGVLRCFWFGDVVENFGVELGDPSTRLEDYQPGDPVTVRVVRTGATTYEVWYGTRGQADRLLTDGIDFGTHKIPTIPGLMVGGSGHAHNPQMYGCMGNDGEQIWQKFVRKHKHIFLVLSGHIGGDGMGRLTSTGDHGNPVHQLLANYQGRPNGGDGWLRIMRFLPKENKISVRTYSAFHQKYDDDAQNQFELDYRMR